MSSAVTPLTADGRRTRPAGWRPYPVGTDLPLKSGAGGSERVARDVFVQVHRLGVLAEVVQAGESARAVTLERSFSRVLADVSGQVLTPGKAELAGREIRAEETLSLLFLGPPLRFTRDALVVRPFLFRARARVGAATFTHFYVRDVARVAGPM